MTAFVSVIPQCDGWAGACHRGSVYRQVEREAWPPVLASPLSRSAGVLGFSLLSHLDTQASWVRPPQANDRSLTRDGGLLCLVLSIHNDGC